MNRVAPESRGQPQVAQPARRPNLALAALGVSAASALTVILGFGFQVALASLFGTSQQADAYLAAWTLPNILTMVLFGSFSITFVPVFIEYQVQGRPDDAWSVVFGFLYLSSAILLLLCVGLMLGAAPIVQATTPGFAPGSALFQLTVDLFRLLMPSVFFNGIANLLRSVYLAQRRYALAAWAPALNALIMLAVSVLLAPFMGVLAVGVATLVAAVAQCLMLGVPLLRGPAPSAWRTLWHPGIRRILLLMLPWVLSALFSKSNTMIDRFLASQLDTGAIAALGYANRLMTAIVQVLTQGISFVLFPLMAEHVATGSLDQLRKAAAQGVRLTVLLALPMTLAIIALREPLVRVLFEHGNFDALATARTALGLFAYMGAFFATAIGSVLTFVFYARQETLTVALVGVTGFVINVLAAFGLTPLIGLGGPALAYSLTAVFNLVVLAILLRRRLQGFETPALLQLLLRLLPGAFLAWLIWDRSAPLLASLSGGALGDAVGLGLAGLAGGLVFVVLSWICGVTELRLLADQVIRRLNARRLAHKGS